MSKSGKAPGQVAEGEELSDASADTDDRDRSTEWKVYGERTIYDNYWASVALVDVEPPDGERFEHHKVYLPPAAMVAMLDDQDRVFMMWRHRFIPDVWNWELPGGVVDDGEEPAATVAREAVEETGYRPRGDVEHVVTFEPMIGTVTSPHHVFLARGVEWVGDPTEKNESQRTAWVPLTDLPQLLTSGKIVNSGTLVAVLHLLAVHAGQ